MATVLAALSSAAFAQAPQSPGASARSELRVAVEVEEDVYRYTPANNGAGPMWCSGSTCLVRIGDDIFASSLETIADAKPLNNCRWTLHRRGPNGWTLQQADPVGRTREPCPLATLAPGMLLLSANPTLVTDRTVHAGPARPEILQWSARAIDKLKPDYVVSECPLAGPHLKQVLKAVDSDVTPERIGHPIEVMVKAYGL